jgi:predicted Zn-dependent protease
MLGGSKEKAMRGDLGEYIPCKDMTRRHFLWLMAMTSGGVVTGCATNPVTGKQELMLVSEDQEIAIDKENSPHQFSSDYGPLQDKTLNDYINRTGKNMGARTHRPTMPYSFRGVNATYVNAYAFPGGSIACTRGILLALDDEAELAALLGHELGHVNARHTAARMSKGILTQAAVAMAGVAVAVGTDSAALGGLTAGAGSIAAGALLAKYSRDDERQADALGMEYMVRSNYSTKGMIGLMDMLRSLSKRKPNAIEMMFATHPMSDERYKTAVETSAKKYESAKDFPLHRERYMDHTAKLRAIKGAIEEMQNGEKAMAKKDYPTAEGHFRKALKEAPEDYAGLCMMSKCLMAQKKYEEARRYADKAKQVYPEEAQAHNLAGITKLVKGDFGHAYEDFSSYERLLAGNPNTIFLKAYSLEGTGRRRDAANEYYRYLNTVNQGDQAQYAYKRLVEWGYIKPRKR